MRKITILVSLVIFTNTLAFSQNAEIGTVDSLIHEIATTNIYEATESIGFAGTRSIQRHRLHLLVQIANTSQLL